MRDQYEKLFQDIEHHANCLQTDILNPLRQLGTILIEQLDHQKTQASLLLSGNGAPLQGVGTEGFLAWHRLAGIRATDFLRTHEHTTDILEIFLRDLRDVLQTHMGSLRELFWLPEEVFSFISQRIKLPSINDLLQRGPHCLPPSFRTIWDYCYEETEWLLKPFYFSLHIFEPPILFVNFDIGNASEQERDDHSQQVHQAERQQHNHAHNIIGDTLEHLHRLTVALAARLHEKTQLFLQHQPECIQKPIHLRPGLPLPIITIPIDNDLIKEIKQLAGEDARHIVTQLLPELKTPLERFRLIEQILPEHIKPFPFVNEEIADYFRLVPPKAVVPLERAIRYADWNEALANGTSFALPSKELQALGVAETLHADATGALTFPAPGKYQIVHETRRNLLPDYVTYTQHVLDPLEDPVLFTMLNYGNKGLPTPKQVINNVQEYANTHPDVQPVVENLRVALHPDSVALPLSTLNNDLAFNHPLSIYSHQQADGTWEATDITNPMHIRKYTGRTLTNVFYEGSESLVHHPLSSITQPTPIHNDTPWWQIVLGDAKSLVGIAFPNAAAVIQDIANVVLVTNPTRLLGIAQRQVLGNVIDIFHSLSGVKISTALTVLDKDTRSILYNLAKQFTKLENTYKQEVPQILKSLKAQLANDKDVLKALVKDGKSLENATLADIQTILLKDPSKYIKGFNSAFENWHSQVSGFINNLKGVKGIEGSFVNAVKRNFDVVTKDLSKVFGELDKSVTVGIHALPSFEIPSNWLNWAKIQGKVLGALDEAKSTLNPKNFLALFRGGGNDISGLATGLRVAGDSLIVVGAGLDFIMADDDSVNKRKYSGFKRYAYDAVHATVTTVCGIFGGILGVALAGGPEDVPIALGLGFGGAVIGTNAGGWATDAFFAATDGNFTGIQHVGNSITGAATNIEHGAQQAATNVEHGAQQAATNVEHGAQQVATNVEHGAQQATTALNHAVDNILGSIFG